MSAPQTIHPAPALRLYRVRCAGQDYLARAASASMAVADALARHGLRAVSVQPVQPHAIGLAGVSA